jgi:cation:H+ antiporter
MWLMFFLSAAFIIAAGTLLTKNAEKISKGFNLSTVWAGALLLPLATSLPELVTSYRAAVISAPDLAGGNIYGSIIFNLSLIGLIDMVHSRGPLRARRKKGLILTALLSIAVIILSMLGIILTLPYRIGWVGIESIVILIVYLLGSRIIIGFENKLQNRDRHDQKTPSAPAVSKTKEFYHALIFFSFAAVVIIFAGTNLTDTADLISMETGLNRTIVGSLFIAVTTSLPELVTTMTAVRLGHVEMAVANVFGANLFNILIFFFSDVFYTRGPLFHDLSPHNLITALMGILLTTVVIFSLVYPSRRQFLRMGIPSFIIIFGYLLTFIFLFSLQ